MTELWWISIWIGGATGGAIALLVFGDQYHWTILGAVIVGAVAGFALALKRYYAR